MKKIITLGCVGLILMGFTFHTETATYTPQDPLKESMERGAVVYTDYCIQCHLGKGEGIPGTFPPLAKSDWLTKDNITNAIQVVKYGQTGEITVNGETYNGVMAALGLYDDEVADVMNYILNSWGNSHDQMITEDQVKQVTKD
ncbi:c-type cytochrome [Dokdonia ponticola]|uniref:C-type cytochrome n=1 Tax=Dokdonia ponticola TaxID=2041041 RepID=A0ABV9HR55_9FLAO